MGWPQTDLRASHRHGRVKRSVGPTRTRQGREVAREGQGRVLFGGEVPLLQGVPHRAMLLLFNVSVLWGLAVLPGPAAERSP